MYKNILFDLDGTLTDPGEGITNSAAIALEHFGIKVSSKEELYKFIGPPLQESFRDFYGFSDEQIEEGVKVFRSNYKDKGIFENVVYDGIPEMLGSLKAAGCKLYVATSKPEAFAVRILEKFDLMKYFDFVAGSIPDGSRDSKAAVIKYVMEQNNITDADLASTIMVGDRKHDIIGAKDNNMDAIGVLFGYGSEEEFKACGAKFIAATPADIVDIVKA